MKPDFEKMARAMASDIAHGNSTVVAVAKELSRLYAAGYRDGQERMRSRYNCTGATYSMPIEEPPA